jgi:hypothetical protein
MHITFTPSLNKSTKHTSKLSTYVGFCIVAIGLLTGCAFNPFQRQPVVIAPTTTVVVPIAPTALTDEATRALAIAEKNVADARVALALWTAASEKLSAAKLAAVAFDSATVIRLASEVNALCSQSALQAKYPLVIW